MNRRIIIVVDGLPRTGATAALKWFLEWLVELSVDVTVFNRSDDSFCEWMPRQIRQAGLPSCIARSSLREFFCSGLWIRHFRHVAERLMMSVAGRFPAATPTWLMQLCNSHQGKYDVAISYNDDFPNIYVRAFKAKRHFGWNHEDYGLCMMAGRPKSEVSEYLARLDGVFSVSRTAANSLASLSPGIHTHVFHNLYPVKSISLFNNERSCDEICIRSAGRLDVRKRFDWCVMAACELKRKGIKFRWSIYGEGEERESLVDLSRKCGVEDCLNFPGYDENWSRECGVDTIYVQTSECEGWGLAVEEAALTGARVICSNLPVFHELADVLGASFSFVQSVKELVQEIERGPDHYEISHTAIDEMYKLDCSEFEKVVLR